MSSLCNVFTDKCGSVSGVSKEAGTYFFIALLNKGEEITHVEQRSACTAGIPLL